MLGGTLLEPRLRGIGGLLVGSEEKDESEFIRSIVVKFNYAADSTKRDALKKAEQHRRLTITRRGDSVAPDKFAASSHQTARAKSECFSLP